MKFPGEFDGSDTRKYPKKKQSRRSKRGDSQVDDAVTIFPTDEEVSMRIEEPPVGEPSTGEATPSVIESSVKEVPPSVAEKPKSVEATEDVQEPAYNDIPFKQRKVLDEIISAEKVWVNTPPPIIEALKSAGFKVIIASKGNIENPGDTLQLSQSHSTESYSYTTNETILFLKQILWEQRKRSISRKPAKKKSSKTPVVNEDAPLPVKEDPEVAVVANTLPVTLDGEVVQNQAPDTKNFVLSDAGIEDAVILSETPRPNIGKEQVRKPAELPAEIPGRESEEAVTRVTNKMLRERANRIAKVRAEILENEEAGPEAAPEVEVEPAEREVSAAHERPKMLNKDILSAFGVTEENWELIPGSGNISTDEIEEVLARTIREEGGPEHTETSPAPERPKTFDERLASEFGVTKEMWDRIPGSEKLSFAQQKLVFENLREFSERDKAPHLARVWEGIKEKLGSKKDIGPTLTTLTQLVESAAQYGPKVHEEAGELMIDFVGIEMPRENRKEWKQAFDSLNEAAHRLSKTPASWQEDGIGIHSEKESKMMSFMKENFSPARKRFNEYKEIEETYVAAKMELSRVLEAAHVDPVIIADRLVNIDKNVYALQFLQTSPDAVEAIKDIPDENMWKMVGKSLCKPSNLGYMALGALGRTALAGAMGVFAAPVTGAAIAGGRAWNKSAAEMRERDRAARMGARDTSGEALNIVSAEMSINIGGEMREVGATQKLNNLIDKYYALRETHDIEELYSPEYVKDMNILLESIRVRASYVEDKQRLNRINFGNKEERAVQMAKLYETLALAQIIVATEKNFPKIDEPIPDWRKNKDPKTLEERLASELSKTENKIQNKRQSRQVKDASWNALRAGAFAAAGGQLARQIQELGLGEKLANLVGSKGVDGLSPYDEPLLTAEEVARAGADSAVTPREDGALFMDATLPKVGEVPEVPKFEPYTIRSGDTLTKIMKEKLPEIQQLGAGKGQNTAIANILRELSPEELKSIGVTSLKPDLIYAGDKINIEALHKIIEAHQSIIDEAVLPVDDTANVAEKAESIKVSEDPTTRDSFTETPEVIEEQKVVTAYAEGYENPSQFEYTPGLPNASEDPNLRNLIYKGATEDTQRWMKLYPRANAEEAVKAGIVEGHFKNIIGAEKWATTGEVRVTDMLSRGPGFTTENTGRMMSEFRTLVDTMQKPPMNVAPMPAENMKEYLERASMAYALRGNGIPPDNLIRKIETYYQSTKR